MSHLTKLTQIARRDYTKEKDIDESDDDDDGTGEYNIDPSSNMWRPVDFGRSSKKSNSLKTSESESKFSRSLGSKSEKGARTKDDIVVTSPRANPSYISPRGRNDLDEMLPSLSLKAPSIIANADKKKSFARLTGGPPRETEHPSQFVSNPTLVRNSSSQMRDQIERQKLAKEREEMKQMLEAIHREKRELAKLSDETQKQAAAAATVISAQLAPPEPDLSAIVAAEALAKEREEMRQMMDEIQREKKEMMMINARRTKEKSQESALAAKERDELRIALENMRSQNEHLVTQMRTSEAAARMEIEQERRARQEELRKIEAKNKELTQAVLEKQAEAERKLAAERDELKTALKRMENEKIELSRKVRDTEAIAKADALALEAQRKEFQTQLDKMEAEKQSVYRQVAENEAAAKSATEEMSRKLAKEKAELQEKLRSMESDKTSLAQSLQEKEAAAKRQAEELAKRLIDEKNALLQSTERMESEKMELAKTLSAAEEKAKEQARIVSEQLEKEKKALQDTKLQMQREREELEAKLRENEKKSAESNAAMSDELAVERERLKAHLEAMQREKEDMEARLKEAAGQALEREKAANDRLAKERDELRQAVERMKEEMELEKKRLEEERNSMAKATSKHNLKPTSSLYDMMEAQSGEGENISSMSTKTTRNNRSHAILPIAECEEEGLVKSHSVDETAPAADTVTDDSHQFTPEEQKVTDVTTPTEASDVSGPIDVNGHDGQEELEEDEEDDFVDLPAPHAAAARGDLDKLSSLARMDPSLLTSFDEAGRSPLFYAVAYNRASATSYLLGAAPECIHQTDAHGDTPLHAGASGGSDACVSLIIEALQEHGGDMNPRNSMGMTPVHLAMSAKVLKLLYEAGADLTAVDKSDRSGLFVAAAMNRKDCVEFLLDCLDGDDDALYMQDTRGDTPLHAAACNGAEDSLLLLLQCGISPLTMNKRGLKAIDLAQKNKKKKCREILAQYHLHFATNSDFDSVLFIAALEVQSQPHSRRLTCFDTLSVCFDLRAIRKFKTK